MLACLFRIGMWTWECTLSLGGVLVFVVYMVLVLGAVYSCRVIGIVATCYFDIMLVG